MRLCSPSSALSGLTALQPRNEQYFCHHREGARSRGAGRRSSNDVAYWQIVLKNSKIADLRKSRKCSALAISATARLCRIDTNASDPFLRSLMWSLTPQRERRTSGPENFQSSAKKDFFNTIGTKRISIRRWSMR